MSNTFLANFTKQVFTLATETSGVIELQEKQNYRIISNNLFSNRIYWIPVILTSILSYSYTLFNFVPGIDDLATEFYLTEGLWAQGRFTNTLLSVFSGFWESYAFAQDFIAVILVVIAAAYMSSCLYIISGEKINILSLTVFSCVFISCPLISEIFMFCGASFNFGVAFIATTIAAKYGYTGVLQKNFKHIVLSCVIMFFIASLYEAFFSVYASIIVFFFIIEHIYSDSKNKDTLISYIKRGAALIPILTIAIAAEVIVSKALLSLLKIEEASYLHETLTPRYFSGDFIGTFIIMIKEVVAYHLTGFWNFPVAIVNITILLLIVFSIYSFIKTRKFTLPFLFICAIFCLFLMSLILGGQAKPRTLESMYITNAFAFMLLAEFIHSKKSESVKQIFAFCICLLIMWQGSYMTKLFFYEKNKFDAEITTIEEIYFNVKENFGIDKKPMVWVGYYELTDAQKDKVYITNDAFGYRILNSITNGVLDSIYDYSNTGYITPRNGVLSQSTINWTINGLRRKNVELYTYFDYLGLEYIPADKDMYDKAVALSENMESNTIQETEDFIIVKLN